MSVDSTRASAATLAKAALRRLAQSQLEPTPENYARAYAEQHLSVKSVMNAFMTTVLS